MTFEWDPGKADANRRKHGVDFADAVGVFEAIRLSSARRATPRERRRYAKDVDA
jgi:uncharacterized DUF497 family protein